MLALWGFWFVKLRVVGLGWAEKKGCSRPVKGGRGQHIMGRKPSNLGSGKEVCVCLWA
jgi:hypothetical protein